MNERCIHGTEKETCFYCNGGYDKSREQQKVQVQDREEYTEFKKKYEEIKARLRNHYEDWSVEEWTILYDNFKSICNIKSRLFRKTVYKVACELERTRLSVIWQYKHMFIIKDYGRAKNLKEFMDKLTKDENK